MLDGRRVTGVAATAATAAAGVAIVATCCWGDGAAEGTAGGGGRAAGTMTTGPPRRLHAATDAAHEGGAPGETHGGPTLQPPSSGSGADKYTPVSQSLAPSYEVRMPPSDGWKSRRPLPVVLSCEHAGSELPPGYSWGEDAWLRGTHWAVDIGIREFCLSLQESMQVPAVLASYSRLFCDCNRPPPILSDGGGGGGGSGQGGASAEYLSTPFLTTAEGGRPIALNRDLTPEEMERRLAGTWRPYHNALSAVVEASPPDAVILSVHSYTRQFEVGDASVPPPSLHAGRRCVVAGGHSDGMRSCLEHKGAPGGAVCPTVCQDNPPREVEVGILCYPDRDLGPGQPATRLLALLRAAGVDARINEPCGAALSPV
jgi:predicted N-formylglutamate amidohydrolase